MIFNVKPAVVGHRGSGSGAARGYRENSVESFLAAAASGASWVELDVRRSSDGELVVWHDPRTPAGQPVAGLLAAQLAAEGIVPLADVLAALPADIGVNMDVKTTLHDATEPADRRTHALLAAALARYRGSRPLLVSSFDPSVPVYLKRHAAPAGDVALGLLTSENLTPELGVVAAANLGLDAACLYVGTLQLESHDDAEVRAAASHVFEAAHQAGLEIMTWTATPAEAALAASAGIDAVCVDDVPGTVAALAAARET